MAAYISKKNSWLRFLVSFLPAAGTAALLWILFSGPRLGPFYDFLLRRRPAPPVSGELLLIDSLVPGRELGDDILEPGAAASLLYTMTELGARTLIIQVPVLGLSAGGTVGEAEILYRFDEEFSLLSRNIRNLFDAIRTGSVAPGDAARYVGELVELSDRGKDRLVAALVRRDEEGIDSMERAAAFFGEARRPGDLSVQLIRAGAGGRPGVLAERDEYSRPRPDKDGILRRIAPVSEASPLSIGREHIIYGALKSRYASAGIEPANSTLSEDAPRAQVLALRNGPSGQDTIIPLDRNGAVLFEPPRKGEDFRRIGISDFLSYDEADRQLRRLLAEGDALGIFQGVEGENNPAILYDYAFSLREELSASPAGGGEGKRGWIESRRQYFAMLDDFLYGPTEMNLVGGYEEIIASESIGEAGIARVTEMRDSLIRTFVALRDKYNEVLELRNKLEAALSGSFCVLGRGSQNIPAEMSDSGSRISVFADFPRAFGRFFRSVFSRYNPTDAEASALLANSILTGRAVSPGEDKYLLAGALIAAFAVCFVIKSLNLSFTLWVGAFLTFLTGMGFSISFIISGIWLDPLIPAFAAAAGVLVSFIWALIARHRYARHFRLAFGPFVSRPCLKSVIRAGKPLPSKLFTVRAAVVAVRNAAPNTRDAQGGAADKNNSTRTVLAFREKVSGIFRKAGGTIIGTEGDMVCACFGSPLERVFMRDKKEASPYEDNINARAAPAMRAVDFVTEIARSPEGKNWHFGLDTGDCSFAWTAQSGYFALGIPVQRAKVLSRLAGRYEARVIISASINEALPDLAVKKLDAFKDSAGAPGEPFYRLGVH